jgi:23S rRNA pseudouridine1911/1915/1917 synthase
LEARLKAWLKLRDNKPGNIYLGVPHRLDRPVSGAMVFARHVRAARRLAEQFEARTVRKVYWACVEGHVVATEGTWEDHMRKVPDEPRAEIVAADAPDAQRAVLHYRVLGRSPHGSWLEIQLETGRMHQIRVQAAHRGHPILGDTLYGATTRFGSWPDDPRQRAIALHGRTLAFQHPMSKEPVSVTAPLPAEWEELHLRD